MSHECLDNVIALKDKKIAALEFKIMRLERVVKRYEGH
jgi:hypothetical protein